MCSLRSGGKKNLHKGLKSEESAEHMRPRRENKARVFVKYACARAFCCSSFMLTPC